MAVAAQSAGSGRIGLLACARHVRPLSLAALAALLTAPLAILAAERSQELYEKALNLDPNANRGAQVYVKACAGCHGDKAWGVGESSIPALAGQRERYVLRQLADFAEINRDAAEMHRVGGSLSAAPEQQWRDIAAYVASLPMNPRPQPGDGKSLDIGSGIYRDSCTSCHGEEGQGDDDLVSPALAGQHYSYLLRQIRGMATGHRFSNVDFDLALMLDNLSAADMAAVADYISRLNTQPTTAQLGR